MRSNVNTLPGFLKLEGLDPDTLYRMEGKEYYGDEYPFYKPGDLDKGINIDSSIDGLSQKGYDASRKLKAFSVLVTCIGATIGKTGLISKDGACNQQINAIIPVSSLFPKYIYYTINKVKIT